MCAYLHTCLSTCLCECSSRHPFYVLIDVLQHQNSVSLTNTKPGYRHVHQHVHQHVHRDAAKQTAIPGGGKELLPESKDAKMTDGLLAEVCVYTHAHARACAHVYACVCKHMPTHKSVHISVHTCVCIAMCMSRNGSLDGSST